VAPNEIPDYAALLAKIKARLGNFVIGFDLVGHEDNGKPLLDFAGELLQMAPQTKFFFHAGETSECEHKAYSHSNQYCPIQILRSTSIEVKPRSHNNFAESGVCGERYQFY